MVMDDFEEIMKKRLIDFKKFDNCVSGYVIEDSYEALLDELRVVGYSYSVRTSRKHGKTTLAFSAAGKGNFPGISYFGYPFHRVKNILLECSLGPLYYTKGKQIDESVPSVKKRRNSRGSKKINCPAWLVVQCIKVFTEYYYGVEMPSTWRLKASAMNKLKEALHSPSPPAYQIRYYITGNAEHNHTKTAVDIYQTIHPKLSKEIRRLVRNGITSTKLIKAYLKSYTANLFNGENLPPLSNKAFYPTHKAIYNCINHFKHQSASDLHLGGLQSQEGAVEEVCEGAMEEVCEDAMEEVCEDAMEDVCEGAMEEVYEDAMEDVHEGAVEEECEGAVERMGEGAVEEVFAPIHVAAMIQEVREEAKLWVDMSYHLNDVNLAPAIQSSLDMLRSTRFEIMKLLSSSSRLPQSSGNKRKLPCKRKKTKARIVRSANS